MGTIWAATDQTSDKRVAVKVINEELARDASLRERFRREAMAAAALNNPHIVRTLDFGREPDGRAWIVMEYVEGETLSDAMKREAPIAQRRVVFIAAQILIATSSRRTSCSVNAPA
jgi:serine/threonine-protein kinase